MWNDISAYDDVIGYTLESRISKLVVKLVRHLDLANRESDGAVHWNSVGPKLRHAFPKDIPPLILNGVDYNKTRFQYCKNSHDVPFYTRAIQGHTGGSVIAPELVGHLAHSDGRNSCITEDVLNVTSILQAEDSSQAFWRERRETVFFHETLPVRKQKNFNNDLSRSRRVIHDSEWKPHQDTVCWSHLARSTSKRDCSIDRQGLTPLFTIQC